jgi:hypothetical protein
MEGLIACPGVLQYLITLRLRLRTPPEYLQALISHIQHIIHSSPYSCIGHCRMWVSAHRRHCISYMNLVHLSYRLIPSPLLHSPCSSRHLIYNLSFCKPFHPHCSAINSAALSPIPKTVNMGLIVGISGNTPASAILTPLNPLTLNS